MFLTKIDCFEYLYSYIITYMIINIPMWCFIKLIKIVIQNITCHIFKLNFSLLYDMNFIDLN